MKKLYCKSRYGRKIRIHRTKKPSRNLIEAIDEVVDQITWRFGEWKLGTKEGFTNLISKAALNNGLGTKDLLAYIEEIKARRYGPIWNVFLQRLSEQHPRIAKVVAKVNNWTLKFETNRILQRSF